MILLHGNIMANKYKAISQRKANVHVLHFFFFLNFSLEAFLEKLS